MIRNYLKVAFRNLRKHKAYSLINISGLAVGMACAVLILLWVRDEAGYDRFHSRADTIFRVVFSTSDDGRPTNANGSFGVGPALKRDFPEVVEMARLRKMEQSARRYVGYGDRKFYESRFLFAEPAFLEIFDFPLVRGDPATALNDPNSVILTEDTAARYFGADDPMGKVIEADPYNDGKLMLFRVTGVAGNIPRQSHVHFDFLASYKSLKEDTEKFAGFYRNYTYVMLRSRASADALAPLLLDFLHRNWQADPWYTISLQPLLDIHLRSGLRSEIEPGGNIAYVYFFTAIALAVLVIACINFMNLATARAAKRAREVGIRKAVGAPKNRLVRQFLGESFGFSALATGAAVLVVVQALPLFDRITGKGLTLQSLLDPWFVSGTAAIAIGVGILAGVYPAFVLSAFSPVQALRSGPVRQGGGSSLRRALVVFQFALSIAIICSTLVIHRQVRYIQSRNIGFDKEHLVYVPLNPDLRRDYPAFRDELLRNPAIENAATSSYVPTAGSSHYNFRFEGNEDLISQVLFTVDKEFLATYGLQLLAGRGLDERLLEPGGTNEFVVSELAAREGGCASPQEAVGKRLSLEDEYGGQIVGVVKDVNIYSLHRPPYPIVFAVRPVEGHNFLSIRLRAAHAAEGLAAIRKTWAEMVPSYPLDIAFLDESFGELHVSDRKMQEVFSVFAGLAIFVAGLGLFGLAAHTAEQRTKEIGIRRILGASVPGIAVMMSREFAGWVLAANLVAWPVAWFVMARWLRGFAYRAELSLWPFVASGACALVVALVTVGSLSLRAASARPVDSIRYE